MYLKYFDKFLNQEPYFHIDSEEWEHIKTTFDKEMRKISYKLGVKVSITEDSEMTDNGFLIKNGIN